MPASVVSQQLTCAELTTLLCVTTCECTHLLLLQHIRDITDPEHPYSLEQLNVVEEDLITVNDDSGHVK